MPTFNPATLDALPGEAEQPPLRLLAPVWLTRAASHRPQPVRAPGPTVRETTGLWHWWWRRGARQGAWGG
ncbi:hypothetical protein [Ideonella livida]|uniref:Uncharacterized protein n=1 Tax=Ideonella livida TaxID=2707176 RepID=A0A7C9TKU4_9BURK|nr:hypothetical protein [Ideonella livida]NDY93000.1 hypothetical protein [Ideonella livida]